MLTPYLRGHFFQSQYFVYFRFGLNTLTQPLVKPLAELQTVMDSDEMPNWSAYNSDPTCLLIMTRARGRVVNGLGVALHY